MTSLLNVWYNIRIIGGDSLSVIVEFTVDEELFIPQKQHESDAGFDLKASHDFFIHEGDTLVIDCGFSMAVPDGYKALILPRSGLALKYDITVLNAPGLIDSGYRGRVKVILHRMLRGGDTYSSKAIRFNKGDRIAQLVFEKDLSSLVTLKQVLSLPNSDRGENGFGSTSI